MDIDKYINIVLIMTADNTSLSVIDIETGTLDCGLVGISRLGIPLGMNPFRDNIIDDLQIG